MISASVIIPVKDEFINLKLILPILKKKYNFCEIIIIDKSSLTQKKKVKKICQKFSIKMINQITSGKGNALREAVKFTKKKYLIFFDSDCSHNPYDISRFLKLFNKFSWIDHIGGSRLTGGSDELFNGYDHILRFFGSIVINATINLKFNGRFTDSQNGFRGIKREKFIKLNTKSHHTTIEMELVALSLSNNLNYIEIPTREYKRNSGISKISLIKHSFSYLLMLIKIIFMKKRSKDIFYLKRKYWDNY
jgi:glycosyltransferase involved in cell wall biosynthesis